MINLDSNSPVHQIQLPILEQFNVKLFVKRDDLIHPMISGNKWRKLKYILKDVEVKNKNQIVTFGGAWSNHLLATACVGALSGLKTLGFVRGEEGIQNPVLSLCRLFGMELQFVDRESYRDKQKLFDQLLDENQNLNPYFIDEGGFAYEALEGCMEIVKNLMPVDHIFCACGTGTTLAGLAKGIDHYGLKSTLHGVPVLAGGHFLEKDIRSLYPQARFQLHTEYHFGGYAKTKPELNEFVKYFCSATGILIEPVYTGKMFYAILDQIKNGKIKSGQSILAIHTGGLTGILGFTDYF